MDRKMLDLGGEANRRTLLARVNSNRISPAATSADIVAESGQNPRAYNPEEAKVQIGGDIGQGDRLTDAKKAA